MKKTLDTYHQTLAVMRMPDELVKIMTYAQYPIFVAGGYLRSAVEQEQPKDIDIFTDSEEHALEIAKKLGEVEYETENAYSVGNYQIIRRVFFNSAKELVEHFDFTACMAALWFEDGIWHSYCAPEFYPAVEQRKLEYRNYDNPAGSLLRALRYVGYGYSISNDELSDLLEKFYLESGGDEPGIWEALTSVKYGIGEVS